jgi:hypothetical protein
MLDRQESKEASIPPSGRSPGKSVPLGCFDPFRAHLEEGPEGVILHVQEDGGRPVLIRSLSKHEAGYAQSSLDQLVALARAYLRSIGR